MPQRRLGKRRYSSYSFPTSALEGGEWSASRPGRALGPGKGPRYPLYRRLGGPQSRSGHRGYRKKSFRLSRGSNLDRPAVQPLARHCTDSATRLTNLPLRIQFWFFRRCFPFVHQSEHTGTVHCWSPRVLRGGHLSGGRDRGNHSDRVQLQILPKRYKPPYSYRTFRLTAWLK
jgi:hypothetical protein